MVSRLRNIEVVVQRSSVKKVFLKISQNAKENTSDKVSFLIQFAGDAGNFIKKETLAQMLSSEFYEIFKNFFFTEQLRWLFLEIRL